MRFSGNMLSENEGFRCRVSGYESVYGCGYAARIGIRKTVTAMKDPNRKTIDETSRASEKRSTNNPKNPIVVKVSGVRCQKQMTDNRNCDWGYDFD